MYLIDTRKYDDSFLLAKILEKVDFSDEEKKKLFKHFEKPEAVNAEPVRHGRWLDVLVVDDDEGETDGVECSECGYTDINVYWAKTYHRFCPNCGAKMDKEIERA